MSDESHPDYAVSLPDVAYWIGRIPCQMACPVHTDAGRYVQLIADQRDKDAYLTARAPNPLASICGRVCAAPCEDRCRRGLFDAPVSIRALKRFVTEQYGLESRNPATGEALFSGGSEPGNKWLSHLSHPHPERRDVGRGRKVAVIGAGPAGLACAHDLAWMGYAPTVFEATARGGGMAFHGIPEFRLPRSLLDREIEFIAGLGAEFRYQTPLTAEHGLAEIRAAGFEAVFLGVGLWRGRGLDCPGSDLDGVIRAVEYLINVNNGYRVPAAKKVLVLGGGPVAFDAARIALRAAETGETSESLTGALQPAFDAARIASRRGAEVTLACLESLDEMPIGRSAQGREELDDARTEGVRILAQRGIVGLSGPGHVERVQLIGVKRTYDDRGRFAPEFDESVREEVEADLVILAIGQQADLSFIRPEDGITITSRGTFQVDAETLGTTAPGVYAGGDAAFGPRNLIDAVADGKRAARSIDQWLRKEERAPRFTFRFEKIPTPAYTQADQYELIPRQAPPTTSLGRRTGISEVEETYEADSALAQARRCLACHVQTIYDPQKCTLCNRCVDVCPSDCLKLVPYEQVALAGGAEDAILELAGATTDEGPLSAMIKDDERCIRCGLCAVRCPTDAMTMEVMYYEQQ